MQVPSYEECDECGEKIEGPSYKVSGPFAQCQALNGPLTFCSEDCLIDWLNDEHTDLMDTVSKQPSTVQMQKKVL